MGRGEAKLSLCPLRQVKKNKSDFKSLALLAPRTLHDNPATTDWLIPPHALAWHPHLHANFRPLWHKCVGHKCYAFVRKMEDVIENGSLTNAATLQVRIERARYVSLGCCHQYSSKRRDIVASLTNTVNGRARSPLDHTRRPSQPT